MDPSELEKKYHVVATEYSKVRSQATVLKKAVLDEQTRSNELKETIKELQQKVRKHNQEMDSLTFRNEQLTKRISVLQQELQLSSHGKKNKNKLVENSGHVVNFGILDEELHKKILENAELASTMADKNIEISNYQEKIEWLEEKLRREEKELHSCKAQHQKEIERLKENLKKIPETTKIEKSTKSSNDEKGRGDLSNFWQQEADRWRIECELLRAKPASNDNLTDYYNLQIRELLESKQLAHSEANSLYAENEALNARIEQLILEKKQLENKIQTNVEDLSTTNDNYKSQLDAMTEHLASQNEKIAKQCDEIQFLMHKLNTRK